MRRSLSSLALVIPLLLAAAGSAPGPVAAAEDGGKVYATNCAACHGDGGKGDGPAGLYLDPKPASFADPAFWAARKDDLVKKAILEGGAAIGKSPVMPAWKASLSAAQVDAVVAYMKSMKGK